MATGDVYFKGGPCDGTTRQLTLAEADAMQATCKGGLYTNPGTGARHNGAIIFDYAGKAPQPSTGIKAPQAHSGWASIQKSVNKRMPNSLRSADRSLEAALRSLNRARKVRL